MKKLVIAFFTVILAFAAFDADAQYYNSSNNYYSKAGNTTYGRNPNGSSWQSSSYGNISRGIDKRGNSWSYNRSTGAYYNSNGTVRLGRGANRRTYKSR